MFATKTPAAIGVKTFRQTPLPGVVRLGTPLFIQTNLSWFHRPDGSRIPMSVTPRQPDGELAGYLSYISIPRQHQPAWAFTTYLLAVPGGEVFLPTHLSLPPYAGPAHPSMP